MPKLWILPSLFAHFGYPDAAGDTYDARTPFSIRNSRTGIGACRTSAVSLPAECSVITVAMNLVVERRVYSALMPYRFPKSSKIGSTAVMLA